MPTSAAWTPFQQCRENRRLPLWKPRMKRWRRVRVLLDEQLPRQLAALLTGHEVRTVRQQSWAGLTNGALLDQLKPTVLTFSSREIEIWSHEEPHSISSSAAGGPGRAGV